MTRSPNKKEQVEIILRGVVKNTPVLSTFLTIYDEWTNKIELENIKKFIECFSNQLRNIENSISQNYLKTNEFAELFHRTIEHSTKTLRDSKIQLFATFLTNSATSDLSSSDSKFAILDIIDRIDLDHIKILKALVALYSKSDHNPIKFEELVEEIEAEENSIYKALCYLISLGLAEKAPHFWVDQAMLYQEQKFSSTPLGIELIEFIKHK